MGTRISSPTFVGRDAELDELDRALSRAADGRAATVLVAGDAGVGKSRLLDEFTTRARAEGAGVLSGSCLQIGEGTLPFAAVSEALRGLVEEVGLDTLRRVAGQSVRELGRIAPALGTPRDRHTAGATAGTTDVTGSAREDGRGEGDGAQVRLFDAALTLLTRLGRERPQVLILEDVHWADQSTRELLVFLSRNLHAGRVLVVATHRHEELRSGHPLRPVLAELSRSEDVRTLDLRPFGPEELTAQLEAILGSPPDRHLVEQVLDRSQGYPFFVEELVASGATESGAPLPQGLREILLATLDALPLRCQEVLRVAAAAGRKVSHELLSRVVDLDPTDLDDALRPAIDRRVLLADLAADTFVFRHALFAEAISATLLPGERQRIHRRLAEVLEVDRSLASATAAAELAHHWHLARDDRRCLAASLEAAREAEAMHAVVSARDHVELVADTWDRVPDAAELSGMDQVAALAWLADLTHLAGDAPRAVRLAEDAIRRLGDDADPIRHGLLLERLATYRSSVNHGPSAAEAWELAVATIPADPPTPARAKVLASHASAFWEHDAERARGMAEEAVAIAHATGAAAVESRALLVLGLALSHLGHVDEAVAHVERSRVLAEDHGAPPEDIVRASNYLSVILIRGGRPSQGADEALAALERARELGVDRLYGPGIAGNATSGCFWSGRWDEAQALRREATGTSYGVSWLQLLQARLAAHRGDPVTARQLLDAAMRDPTEDAIARFPSVAIAVARLGGDLDEARRISRGRHDYGVPVHGATVNELRALGIQVEAEREDPDLDLADELLAETVTGAGGGAAASEPWRLTALAEHARLRSTDTTGAWSEALAAWRTLGYPYLIAYASFRLADAAVAVGSDATDVEDLLGTADATARELGAIPLRDDVLRLARRAGVALAPSPAARRATADEAPYGLTPRETEVLALVADGLSNRDIGERLFISQKTASVHVSNILRKLDVSGRGEAAALAFREGLVGAG